METTLTEEIKTNFHYLNTRAIQDLQISPTQKDVGVYWESNPSSPGREPKSPQLEPAIKDQKKARVSKGHVNTRFFIISDIHTEIFKPDQIPKEAAAADVMICCGDLTNNSELHEYRSVINMLSVVTAPLKLVVAGNHDGTLDSEGFWDTNNWRYERWPRKKNDKAGKLFGNKGEARRLLEKEGFIILDEGHHTFSLDNGAELKVYASPATPKRKSSYKAFQYKKQKSEGQGFSINKDVDVAITHGPPKGILDPDPLGKKYRGCEDLFDSIARARPRLHCFGHNHGGWGATLVEWKGNAGDEQQKTKESSIQYENELMSLKDIDPAAYGTNSWDKDNSQVRKRELAKLRCVPTSHCAGDIFFVEKRKQTLFINASWSKADKNSTGRYSQWPWLVDIEIPKQQDDFDSVSVDGVVDLHTPGISRDGTGKCQLTVEYLAEPAKRQENGDTDNDEQVLPGQKTAGKQTDSKQHPQVGSRPFPGGKYRRGVYGFQDQNRNIEVSFWRPFVPGAEQQGGDMDGFGSSPTQGAMRMNGVDIGGPSRSPERSPRRQRHGGRSPSGEESRNKRYGFSKGEDRDMSRPWRQDCGAKEGGGDRRDNTNVSRQMSAGADMKNNEGNSGSDRGSKGNGVLIGLTR